MTTTLRTLILATVAALGAACGGRTPSESIHAGLHATSAEIAVGDAIADAHRLPRGSVDVMVGRAELRIVVSDAALAQRDGAARAAAAREFVATAERVLASEAEFPAVATLSVAIVHPPAPAHGELSSHTEEVYEFRRGPNNRFVPR